MRESIAAMLSGGDRRSTGRADEVVDLILARPGKAAQLIKCLWHLDPLICMRAADASEKVSRERPDLIQPYKASLLGLLAEATQQELRWHLAVILPRLKLTGSECGKIAKALQTYLDDRSSIVKTYAMQGLADLTNQDVSLRPMVIELLKELTRSGTPAMRARGRILLKQFADQSQPLYPGTS